MLTEQRKAESDYLGTRRPRRTLFFVADRCLYGSGTQFDRLSRILVNRYQNRVRVAIECVCAKRTCDFHGCISINASTDRH